MNVDHILRTMSEHGVGFLLIGGMNFLLRHKPVLTFDIDLWIEDSAENRARCERALVALGAEWGATEEDWGSVAARKPGWLGRQALFCLSSPHGAIDVFRAVKGLGDWSTCRGRSVAGKTAAGVAYQGLADEDMLQCQLSLDPQDRKEERILVLRQAIAGGRRTDDGCGVA